MSTVEQLTEIAGRIAQADQAEDYARRSRWEIGRDLATLKASVPRGQWGAYLAEAGLPDRTVRRHISFYHDNPQGPDGELPPFTWGNKARAEKRTTEAREHPMVHAARRLLRAWEKCGRTAWEGQTSEDRVLLAETARVASEAAL